MTFLKLDLLKNEYLHEKYFFKVKVSEMEELCFLFLYLFAT